MIGNPGASKQSASGNYAGTGVSHQITTGFKCSLILIIDIGTKVGYILMQSASLVLVGAASNFRDETANVYAHASDGFQVGTTALTANDNVGTYYWFAIEE